MYKSIIVTTTVILFVGCAGIQTSQRLETVVDRVYIPKECPTFNYQIKINGKKYVDNKILQTNDQPLVITELKTIVESLEKNNLVRKEFNKKIEETNKELIIPGKPTTNNFKRIQKRIFVDRECPKYYYKPTIKVKKLTNDFRADKNTTYIIIPLDELVTELEQNKLAREVYNENVEKINEKSFVEAMKNKFDVAIAITVEKIDETVNTIKKIALKKTKDVLKNKAKEVIFGKEEETDE